MKKVHSTSLLFLVVMALVITACSPSRFSTRRYKKERVTVQTPPRNNTITKTAYTPASNTGTNENVYPVTTGENTEEVKNSPAPVTSVVTTKDDAVTTDHKIHEKPNFRRKIKRNEQTLKTTETTRSAVWLAYGITSFVLGFLALAFIPLAIFVNPAVIFVILGMAFAIMAVIFGIMGLKAKRLRFLPILGLVMGAAAVIAWIVIIILLALLII